MFLSGMVQYESVEWWCKSKKKRPILMRVTLGRQKFINVINRINVFLNLAALLTWKLRCTQFGNTYPGC